MYFKKQYQGVDWYYVAQCRIVAITVMCILNCIKGDKLFDYACQFLNKGYAAWTSLW